MNFIKQNWITSKTYLPYFSSACYANTTTNCFWSYLMITAWKNVYFPASKPPNLNTVYIFLCTKMYNFPPNFKISLQIPTFPSKELPQFLTFSHCVWWLYIEIKYIVFNWLINSQLIAEWDIDWLILI